MSFQDSKLDFDTTIAIQYDETSNLEVHLRLTLLRCHTCGNCFVYPISLDAILAFNTLLAFRAFFATHFICKLTSILHSSD